MAATKPKRPKLNDANQIEYNEIKPLEIFSAIENGNLEMVRKLLEKGADPNLQDPNGRTLLHTAVIEVQVDIVHELINKGAQVNTEDNCKQSPLLDAAELVDDVDDQKEVADLEIIVKYLLKAGANPNVKDSDSDNKTPLHFAAQCNNTSMVHDLINHGAIIDAKDNDQHTPLHFTAIFDVVEAAKVILQNGANPNLTNSKGETPLHLAAIRGDVRLTRLLLKHGADPNMETATHEQSGYLLSPLHYAVMADDLEYHGEQELFGTLRGHINVVKELVKNGAKIDGNGSHRMPPIHMAMFARQFPEFVYILLKLGANPNPVDSLDDSPLIGAVTYSDVKMVKTLLKHGANINATSGDARWTPLHHAFHGWYGDYTSMKKIVSILLNSGADAYVKDSNGLTPIQEALNSYYSNQEIENIVIIMLEKGKNTKIDRKTSSTILEIAMKKGFVKIARMVLRKLCPEPQITDSIYPLKLFL